MHRAPTFGEKDAVVRSIRSAGMDPDSFEWLRFGTMLFHPPTESIFWFVTRFEYVERDDDLIAWEVGGRSGLMYPARTWTDIVKHLGRWLAAIRAEGDGDRDDNTLFTPDERAAIRAQLDVFMEEIRSEGRLTGAQIETLAERIEYIKGAAERLGRLDWRNLAASLILSTLVEAVLPPEITHSLVETLIRAVGHVYAHRMFPGLLPPPN